MSPRPGEVLDGLVASGQEPGAAVAVVRDGLVEVDHAGGTRDDTAPWTPDTLVMTFSVAKPFAALTLLSAVGEGTLDLDQPVASAWPEYGCRGKQATTLLQLLSHQAGLPAFPEEAARLEYDDRDALVELLAGAAPVHAPGAGVAEHALTYGHLLDEVLRRATGVPLAERFAGIARAAGWDLHLRLEEPDLARVARLVEPTDDWAAAYLADPRWGPALGRPAGLLDPEVLNSDHFRRTAFPAVSLHANALSLARFYDDVLRPDGYVAGLLGRDLWRAYTSPAASGYDGVIGRDVTWTLGFQLDDEDGRVDLGMGGAGGCAAWAEPAAGYGAAYLTRGLGGHARADQVWEAVHAEYTPGSTGNAEGPGLPKQTGPSRTSG
ncbi:serine hydrolase domain-containing protein [Phycicoccus sp. Soil748]|uniref:serine hydrolase domain-containing protein n=1 Tax=Intrasporangiaceae TaxID=85021 RepID=UPI00138F9AA4|nr:serine hydrolase domain-containing protein [Phycicoccus sp. Soil748]